jgi:hypothetical protein
MWAVGKNDIRGISTASAFATSCFSAAGFFAGMLVNIIIACSLTIGLDSQPVSYFLLHVVSWFLGSFVLILIVVGTFAIHIKNGYWKQVEDESRPRVQQP